MTTLKDLKNSLAREEREAERSGQFHDHVMYGAEKPSTATPSEDEMDIMVASGDVHIGDSGRNQGQQQQAGNDPWWQKHALPLAMAAGIGGFGLSNWLDDQKQQQPPDPTATAPADTTTLNQPNQTIRFDPGFLDVITVEPGTLTGGGDGDVD